MGYSSSMRICSLLPGATEIAFKDARIEILSADNSGIRYRVLSGFKP